MYKRQHTHTHITSGKIYDKNGYVLLAYYVANGQKVKYKLCVTLLFQILPARVIRNGERFNIKNWKNYECSGEYVDDFSPTAYGEVYGRDYEQYEN